MTTSITDEVGPAPGRIDPARLRAFAQHVFEKSGMAAADAGILADHLAWADLRGISWLGANKIPEYAARLATATGREPTVSYQRGGFLVVDAEDAFGQVVGFRVMKRLIDAARTSGVSAAVVRNTGSAGALGYFASLAVEEHMVGFAQQALGGLVFAVASPAGRHPSLVLDDQQRRALLPEGVALTADGRPTVDPVAAFDGMLRPMRGHRGFGLALLWKMLTGVLAASSTFSTDVGSPGDTSRPQSVSMLLLAIDPTVSMPYETFTARVDDLIDRIHGARRMAGAEPPRLPGEHAARISQERRAEGIELPLALLTKLRMIAARLDVPALA